jgi:hypothetical protein
MFGWCFLTTNSPWIWQKKKWTVHTTTTWHVDTIQNKVKVKELTALTASLEHEEVLSHSLLDLFSTAMLVQTIANNGANSTHSSHMTKTPSVLKYIQLKIVTLLSYLFYISIQYELYILIQYENLILWKNGTW